MKAHTRIPLTLPPATLTDKPGVVLRPGDSLPLAFSLPTTEYPARHRLRVVGEADIFWRWRCEPGMPARVYRSIADALVTNPACGEQYALYLEDQRVPWPRNAYIKVVRADLPPAGPVHLRVMARGRAIDRGAEGSLEVELGLYRAKEGRDPSDVYDPPDEIVRIPLPDGTYDWMDLATEFTLPADITAVLVRIGGTAFGGEAWIGTPRLYAQGGDSVIPSLAPENAIWPRFNWLGENLSRAEWPQFRIALDGRPLSSGSFFNAIYRWPDWELPLPPLTAGPHELQVQLLADYAGAPPFTIRSAEIWQESARPVEILWAPEYVREGEPFPVLIERNEGEQSTLDVWQVESGPARANPSYAIDCGTYTETIRPRRVLPREGAAEAITLSSGDAIYIPQEVDALKRYLEWYLSEGVGNSMCFRPTYRWSGTRAVNPAAWQFILPLLERLGLRYHLMVDGRELPGMAANPPDSLLAGPNYMGRQSHEHDGAFCYWGPRQEEALFADLFSRGKNPGGIFPHTRPARRAGHVALGHFDPLYAQDMRQAAEYFVHNLAAAKGDSTRHTGPSTLFHYFYQAGYDWLGAEQMYAPEEVTLAALRGAARAVGKSDYGAHLAMQWSSMPHDTTGHAARYFLSLATCYLQGVNNINLEEGLWRMESEYADHDRFSHACTIHQEAHHRFYRYLQTHPRRGTLRAPLAMLQGRYCGWRCFGRGNVWGVARPEFAFGLPEQSFDLLNVFYPRSVLDAIYRNPCPEDQPQGWYSGTPYGPIDLVPAEVPGPALARYDALAFLGWHTCCSEDVDKLLAYVQQGGTLLLARPHLSTAIRRGLPSDIVQGDALGALLGDALQAEQGPVTRQVGTGRVIYFPQDSYPADERIRAAYTRELAALGEGVLARERARGWLKSSPDVQFAAYDWDTRPLRTIYLLNINWWDASAPQAPATLLFGPMEYPLAARAGRIEALTLGERWAVMPQEADADILDLQEEGDGVRVVVQSNAGATLRVFCRERERELPAGHVAAGGVQELRITQG